MREAEYCKVTCRVKLDANSAKKFKEKIDDQYVVNMILDNLPAAITFEASDWNGNKSKIPVTALPVGRKGYATEGSEERHFIYNHLRFNVMYHEDPKTKFSRIVGFEITPYRREALQRVTSTSLEGFDYESILGQCCEMPIGYVTIPVGIVGPLILDGREFFVPMATTEGCLVASTNPGCKAINLSGGASSVLLKDGMTRAPVVRFNSAKRAAELKFFMEDLDNYETISMVFNKSSRFGRLQTIKCADLVGFRPSEFGFGCS